MQVASHVAGESGSLLALDHALWNIRYTVLLQLRHWKLRNLDVWTVVPAPPVAAQAEQLFARLTDARTRIQT